MDRSKVGDRTRASICRSLRSVLAFGLVMACGNQCDITGNGEPERSGCASATHNIFEVLGMRPALGRAFSAEEDRPGCSPVFLLTYGLWQRRFGRDPRVLGQAITVDGRPRTVIGVMPRDYQSPYTYRSELIAPFALNEAEQLQRMRMSLMQSEGRLKPGVTVVQARAEATSIFDSIKRRYPRFYRADMRLNVTPLREYQTRNVRLALWVLLGVVLCVLVIACANVANLLVARASGRRREIAVRASLGASRWRLARQLITESVLLGGIGGAVGLTLVAASTGVLRRFLPSDLPHAQDLAVDIRVLGFAIAASMLTGVVFGLAPAFTTARLDVNEALKEAGSGPSLTRGRLRSALVIAEIAISTAVLVGAGLLIESLWRIETVKIGFRSDHILTTAISLHRVSYGTPQRQAEFAGDLRERVRAAPGVTNVAVATSLPPADYTAVISLAVHFEGQPPADPRIPANRARMTSVSPGYFATLGIPLRKGRLLTDADVGSGRSLSVVNEAFVRRFSPNKTRSGERLW